MSENNIQCPSCGGPIQNPESLNKKSCGYCGVSVVAQEVSEGTTKVKPKNEKDFYSIRYSEFVIPLIKATQEQSETINRLEADNQELTKRLLNLEKIVDGLNKDKKR